ncbi:MAG: ATP-grasp domain-containing protein [Deltaproteobacteria bacterium]|nr:ATP-grasp domain-containing protein [Deltaproteobacteria bacterium]
MQRSRILILWNQLDDDVYTHFRRDGRRAPDWDPTLQIEPWETGEEEMQLIQRSLEEHGHTVTMVNVRDNFDTMLDAIRTTKPDVVMNLVEFFRDDAELEHDVPALYELLGVEYTGNRPLALSLCQKKPQAKALLAAHGLPVPRGVVIESIDAAANLDLEFPIIVKPAFDDASGGIDAGSVVHDRSSLIARIDKMLHEHKQAALVEEYIEGREIHCAILGDRPLPLYEMQFKGGNDEHGKPLPKIITYRAKWDPYSREHHAVQGVCPVPDLDPALARTIEDVAMRAYRALGCRDYARVDMRVDSRTNQPYILEVNPNPDLAESCAFNASAKAAGLTYAQMICEIVDLAIARKAGPKKVVTGVDALLKEYLAKKQG